MQLLISPVEALVGGCWPCVVQDLGRWQIVLQAQQEFLCLGWEQRIGSGMMISNILWQADSHPDPATHQEEGCPYEKQEQSQRDKEIY